VKANLRWLLSGWLEGRHGGRRAAPSARRWSRWRCLPSSSVAVVVVVASAYDGTGRACASAAFWRSSALAAPFRQCLPDAAIGPGYEYRVVGDCHVYCSSSVVRFGLRAICSAANRYGPAGPPDSRGRRVTSRALWPTSVRVRGKVARPGAATPRTATSRSPEQGWPVSTGDGHARTVHPGGADSAYR
jgi:hypothetical protein